MDLIILVIMAAGDARLLGKRREKENGCGGAAAGRIGSASCQVIEHSVEPL